MIEITVSILAQGMATRQIKSADDLGRVIRRQRKLQALRQQDLADQIGASHVFLRQVEQGKPTVQLGRVLRLLEELGIELHVDVPDAHE